MSYLANQSLTYDTHAADTSLSWTPTVHFPIPVLYSRNQYEVHILAVAVRESVIALLTW